MLSWIGPRRLWRGVIGSLVFCLAFYPATILTRHVAAQGKTPSSIAAHVEAAADVRGTLRRNQTK